MPAHLKQPCNKTIPKTGDNAKVVSAYLARDLNKCEIKRKNAVKFHEDTVRKFNK